MTLSLMKCEKMMLHLKYLPVLLLSAYLVGCTGTDAAEDVDRYTEIIARAMENNRQLRTQNEELSQQVSRQQEQMQKATELINGIMDGLAVIAEQEGEIREVMTDVGSDLNREGTDTEDLESLGRRMNEYIEAIDDHIQESKGRLQQLQEAVQSSKADLAAYKATVERLRDVVAEKEKAVAGLKRKMSQLLTRVETLEVENDTLQHIGKELRSENKELREAFYIVSTKDDLEDKNIVEKKFLRPTRLEELDPRYFTAIDIQVEEIPLPEERDRAKVFSIHKRKPHLYEIQSDRLVVKNPREFWSVSRYLIVEIDK